MAREVLPNGQNRVFPYGTLIAVLLLVGGTLWAMSADGRGSAAAGLVMVVVKLVCWGYFLFGLPWALYLLWGKDRDTNAALLTLGMSVLCGIILVYLLVTGQAFTW